MHRTSFYIALFIFSLLFISCSKSKVDSDTINLNNRFYWAECDKNSTIEDINKLRFHKFTEKGFGNLKKITQPGQEYIWLMSVFTIPEHLKNKPLGLLITYLTFADKVWVNDAYVGEYGKFPPNAKSALWTPHFYSIPQPILNQVGKNILLIKVHCKGRNGISENVFIGESDKIKEIHTFRIFLQSSIYLFGVGGMFFTALLFLLIFIWRRRAMEYLSFSMLCLASIMLTTPFFSANLPLSYPNNFPHTLFIKFTLCEGFYLIAFCFSTLVIEFVKKHETKQLRIIRLSILFICSIITLAAPSYDYLMIICPYMQALSITQNFFGFAFVLHKIKTPEEKRNFKLIILVSVPLIIAIILDFFVKTYLEKVDSPYITLFGWEIVLISFMVILSVRYNQALIQNEYHNINLRIEVHERTSELSRKNAELERQINRAETDLEMASLVQKKFFPYPPKTIRGWDIAVSYSPLDKVSGDMYDYYIEGNTLNGFSLFDVSGHGIAASLITMLSKNIIYQSFERNMRKNETVSRTLYEINDEIIEAKGGIENYLTGLMFRFKPFDEDDVCKVEMANAGHPNPFFFSAEDGICNEIKSGDSASHHGAIGLDFITVSFPQISFKMAENDILLFYTDGLTEGRNKDNEMFGKERVKKILRTSCAKSAQSIMEDIIDAFNEFTKDVKRDDDITVVVMKRENSNNYVEELQEL